LFQEGVRRQSVGDEAGFEAGGKDHGQHQRTRIRWRNGGWRREQASGEEGALEQLYLYRFGAVATVALAMDPASESADRE
jgi:hypothetical protein